MYTVLGILWLFLFTARLNSGRNPATQPRGRRRESDPGGGLRRGRWERFGFASLPFMIAMYVLLDGFDLGAGAIHLLVAKTDEERRQVLASIGPVWDGNEVWLLAAGGTLYFAFPALYASGFSGFYLPLMMVLWLLILRGSVHRVSQSHQERGVGSALGFSVSALRVCCWPYSSARRWAMWCAASRWMPAVIFSSRCGPISGSGKKLEFLDWYTILVGVLALFALVDAWRAVGANENQWRSELARGKTGWASLVGRDCSHGARDGGDISRCSLK